MTDRDPNALKAKPGIRTKIYVRDDMIGGGKVDLLRIAAEKGSLTEAAEHMGVGLKRARFLLETLQRCFADPLFDASEDGAVCTVTPLGHDLLRRHAAHEAAVAEASADFLNWIESNQPSGG